MVSPRRGFLLVFALHLGLYGLFLTRVHRDVIRPHARWEINAVALALYERGEFADPYAIPTGSTAHMPPFLPALMAGLYHLLGPTLAAGYVTWLVVIASYGAMYAMLPWLGARLGLGAGAGLAAGLVGAVIPRWPGSVEGFAGVAIGLMLVEFLRRWEEGLTAPGRSFAFGLAIGLSFLVSPSLLPVPLGLLAVEVARPGGLRMWRPAAVVLLGMTLACIPWTLRNVRALGGFVFVRSNFGLELRMGNHEGAGATLEQSARGGTERHPRTNLVEAERVARLGELEYMRAAGREATAWIRGHPGEFARLTALRVAQFWLGPVDDLPVAAGMTLLTVLAAVGAARSFPRLGGLRRAAILVPLATFPLVYYLVGFEARYRQPLDGLLLLLAAAAFAFRGAATGTLPGLSPPRGRDRCLREPRSRLSEAGRLLEAAGRRAHGPRGGRRLEPGEGGGVPLPARGGGLPIAAGPPRTALPLSPPPRSRFPLLPLPAGADAVTCEACPRPPRPQPDAQKSASWSRETAPRGDQLSCPR